jgi:hypothetical protein
MGSSVVRPWVFGIGRVYEYTYASFDAFKALFDDEDDQMFADLYSAQETETT